MSKKINRIMFAAPSSGSGKTMITCGFLNLLKKRKLDVTSYKCGPDYIDPMFHRTVLGIYGGNLDTFFCPEGAVRDVLSGCDKEYAVVEGVMGVYDGLGGLEIEASSYDVAVHTDTPVILIVDARGAGRTILSIIKGVLADDTAGLIKGIILNRTTGRFYERLGPFLNAGLSDAGYETRVCGYLPVIREAAIDSRHLGLVMPDEIEGIHKKIDLISETLEETVDIKKILSIMDSAPDICDNTKDETNDAAEIIAGNGDVLERSVRIAVAKDEAFCFYYRENLDLLEKMGAELVFFSPIHDEKLPEDIDGICIGGGYPELHLNRLSENRVMLKSVRKAIAGGLPSLAECGGFMYLHDAIEDREGRAYDMAGVVHGKCVWTGELKRFGYVTISSDGFTDGMRGHEFHRYMSTADGSDVLVKKAGGTDEYRSMYVTKDHVWGFPHLYYMSKPEFVSAFLDRAASFRAHRAVDIGCEL